MGIGKSHSHYIKFDTWKMERATTRIKKRIKQMESRNRFIIKSLLAMEFHRKSKFHSGFYAASTGVANKCTLKMSKNNLSRPIAIATCDWTFLVEFVIVVTMPELNLTAPFFFLCCMMGFTRVYFSLKFFSSFLLTAEIRRPFYFIP